MCRVLPTLIAIAALASFAAGCGDDDDEGTTVTETATGSATETTAPATEATETPAPAEGKEGPDFFSTPSGNIACHVSRKAVRCDIRKRDWKPTPASEPCELDYGHGILATPDHAEFVCAGDTTLGVDDTLAYGERSRRGPFTCLSEPDGITCSHAETGVGFFLSRASFRIF